MSKRTKAILIALAGLILLVVFVLQIPAVKSAVAWRFEKYTLYVKNIIDPPGPVPTALPVTSVPPTQTSEVPPSGTMSETSEVSTPPLPRFLQ